jgi:hypothetical protein
LRDRPGLAYPPPVGASVVITGSDLNGAWSVKVNGTSATFTVNSSTQITAKVPSGATSGTFSVSTPAGSAASTVGFTVILPAVLNAFSPTRGLPGAIVTLYGSGFLGVTRVTFLGSNAQFTIVSSTQIRMTAPTFSSASGLLYAYNIAGARNPIAFTIG